MQYKTIQVEHYQVQSVKDSQELYKKYEFTINQQAMDGWKLLGIHTLPITRRAGCIKMITGVWWERLQADILIFFKE